MNATDTTQTIEHGVGDHGIVTVRLADWDAEIRGIDGDTARVWNANGGPLPDELQVDRTADGIAIRQYDKGLTIVLGRRSRDVRLAIEVPQVRRRLDPDRERRRPGDRPARRQSMPGPRAAT